MILKIWGNAFTITYVHLLEMGIVTVVQVDSELKRILDISKLYCPIVQGDFFRFIKFVIDRTGTSK